MLNKWSNSKFLKSMYTNVGRYFLLCMIFSCLWIPTQYWINVHIMSLFWNTFLKGVGFGLIFPLIIELLPSVGIESREYSEPSQLISTILAYLLLLTLFWFLAGFVWWLFNFNKSYLFYCRGYMLGFFVYWLFRDVLFSITHCIISKN